MSFIVASLVASLVLTVALNAGLALFARRRHPGRSALPQTSRYEPGLGRLYGTRPKVKARLFFPWKAMLVVSIVATVAINLLR